MIIQRTCSAEAPCPRGGSQVPPSPLGLTVSFAGLLVVAGADDATDDSSEETVETGSESSGPLMPSEFAKTITLFPDFPDKSEAPHHRPK